MIQQPNKMIVLTGSSLNKRHQELNAKVNDAAKNKLSFEEIKDQTKKTDVDKLFKIDLASKYKNINYILEVIKSGDSLHISRALGCDWIGDDEFSQFMNPEYLDANVFPFMSPKMKKKLLATLTARIRNGERAEEFHHYCMRNRMQKFGMDFLLYTNETFKIEILTHHPHICNDFNRTEKYLEQFIGSSHLLAEHYLRAIHDSARPEFIFRFRYLYWVSQDKYLDLLETFQITEHEHLLHKTSFRLSKSIMKKNKDRVLKNPRFYLNTLVLDMVVRYSTSDDAKVYAIPFLPEHHYDFWNTNYYKNNEYFLKLIPLGERFSFIKKIFTEKYPGELFEETYRFYTENLYEMMTVEEKEEWALRHVASGKELHGQGYDYIWYKFVNFRLAFIELKKYILVEPDDYERSDILEILIDVASTREELKTLLEYYYDNHINELSRYKLVFLDKLIANHKVIQFNDECWAALEKIFNCLKVYNKLSEDDDGYENNEYRLTSLIYYINHQKPVPEVFYDYVIARKITSNNIKWKLGIDIDSQKRDLIFQYFLQCLTTHLNTLLEEKAENEIRKWIKYILELIADFDKTLEDIPKTVYELIKSDFEEFKYHRLFVKESSVPQVGEPTPPEFHLRDIMHYLKEDASLVITNFPAISEYFQAKRQKRNINWLIRKLKIYFPHDIAPEYVKLLNECLDMTDLDLQTARVAVFGILNLSEEEYRIDFLRKYVPVNAKIDHVNISRNLLTTQTAICSVACHSRPPLPLSSFHAYIKGDYLQHCLPIFDSYLANLTPEQCLAFVEILLDSPVSVQKHGLRLAFQCFSTENLKTLVLKVWKNMRNISLRIVLYKTMFDKVKDSHDNLQAQQELFGVLNIMTGDLHQYDDEQLFYLLTAKLLTDLFSQHLQTGYTLVSTFPVIRETNCQRVTRIVKAIGQTMEHIPKDFLTALMEDHINTALEPNFILNKGIKKEHYAMLNAKWRLIKTAIIRQKDTYIVKYLVDHILTKWHKIESDEYIYRRFWSEFVQDLEKLSYKEHYENYLQANNNIFEVILTAMQNALPFKEIFITFWQFKVNILTRQVLGENLSDIGKVYDDRTSAENLAKVAILKFSKWIGELIKKCIEEKKYFPSFYKEIENIILGVISNIVSNFRSYTAVYISAKDIRVLLCTVLSKYDVREIRLFVMKFLPKDYGGGYLEEYFTVINKLKSSDEVIQYFMCNKFYSSDYVYRDFMP